MSRDALVVGISTYEYSGLKNLEAPAKDAEAIAQCLESSLSPFQVKRLPDIADKKNDGLKVGKKTQVSLDRLKKELFKLFKPKGGVITDTGLFYFSGHGLYDELTEEGYLATSDANPDKGNWGFPLHSLRKLLQDSPVRQQIIWLDCCHSGSLIVLNEANPGKDPKHSRCFIAASRDVEVAYELVSRSHGVLTDALLVGLDPNRVSGEWIDTLSLSAFVNQYLQKEHPTYPQKPLFINDGQVINLILTPQKQESESKSDRPPPQATVGLENIAEIPVWVGRDALIEELKAKLLAPETAPKVLAIIGQGGIGKTSLGVKLLESLGVQLQPPSLTKTCPYQKVLYFKVYPGTSFDSVAEFLLRGLDMETAEPLKTAAEKISQILAGLTKQRGVVLLDNLEDILHPANHQDSGKAVSEEWRQLLHRLVYGNHCSTVILTSREFPVDLADSRVRTPKPDPKLVEMLTLVGVEDEDGVEILRHRGSADSDADQQWIAERVKGNTFVLTQLANISAESPGYLRKHPELVTEEAEPILQAQLMRQSQAGRDLLRQMCVLRVGIDLPGLTFLRLYTDDLEKDDRFEMAVKSEKPASLTKAELKQTQEMVSRLVNSSLVQRRYDKNQCEWYYDLHRLIVEYLQTAYQAELPELMERVYKFYCTGKTVENPQTIEDLLPILEAQYFAFQLGNDREAYSILKYELWEYLYSWGSWNFLKDLYEQILPYVDEDETAYCLISIGAIYRDTGNWDKAETYFQDALAISQKQENRSLIATSQGMLGDIALNRGNWDEAEKLYRQSLELRTQLHDLTGMASSWGCLGDIARNRGNWDTAEKLYRQSLEVRTELGDRAGMASSWAVLGDIERFRGNWDEAENLYRQCLEVITELGDRKGMATSCGQLGDIERFRGNWDAAEKLYQQSLELRTELGDRAGMAEITMNLGENELGKGNLDEAEKYLTEALAKMEELGMTQNIAETNFDLAQLWRQRGNEEIAQQHYQKSQQHYQKLGAMKDLERIEREWNV